jgi:hypothetical protein
VSDFACGHGEIPILLTGAVDAVSEVTRRLPSLTATPG